ncbi:hypothetical protein [Mesobacillus campisalis]|uniref:hypothetical protein n=1 Tax=Mesobacillus campisalis TaxID=1408103 RepID=UPI00069AB6C4|nr:hypothetical protein [Mesobacillus campisalis]
MTYKVSINLSKAIKLLGFRVEKGINEAIQSKLDNEKMIKLAKLGLARHTDTLKALREQQNLAARQLNIPTRDDLANMAKLGIQIEEKLDEMDEKLSVLLKQLEAQGMTRE